MILKMVAIFLRSVSKIEMRRLGKHLDEHGLIPCLFGGSILYGLAPKRGIISMDSSHGYAT